MLSILLVICFISVLGNVFLASRFTQDPYEWILLSIAIGPLSWVFQFISSKHPTDTP